MVSFSYSRSSRWQNLPSARIIPAVLYIACLFLLPALAQNSETSATSASVKTTAASGQETSARTTSAQTSNTQPTSAASTSGSETSTNSPSQTTHASQASSAKEGSPSSQKASGSGTSASITRGGSVISITASNTISSDSGTVPTLSKTAVLITASNTLNVGGVTGLPGLSASAMPTLSSTDVPIPTVTVPSNANNPFMSQSSLPEGTVFIAVGSILLGIALAVVGWNVAMFIITRNSKYIEYTPAGGFGSNDGADSKAAFGGDSSKMTEIPGAASSVGGAHARGTSQVGLGGVGSDAGDRTRPSMVNSGLFFSPTAEVMNTAQQHQSMLLSGSTMGGADSLTSTINSSAGVGVSAGVAGATAAAAATSASANTNSGAAARTSVYMPSGYYAPTTSAGVTGNATMSVYSTAGTGGSNRNTAVGNRESVRAPSAYLDDFLGQDK